MRSLDLTIDATLLKKRDDNTPGQGLMEMITVIIRYCDYLGTRGKQSQYPINSLTSSHKALVTKSDNHCIQYSSLQYGQENTVKNLLKITNCPRGKRV